MVREVPECVVQEFFGLGPRDQHAGVDHDLDPPERFARGDVPAAVAHAEDLRLLTEAIRALPERCRQVLTLRKIYGLSQRETALRLGISEHTVEVQGAIGLRKCIRFFRERGHRT